MSFAAGLVFDLTNLTPLGLSSAVFLAVTLVFHYILTNTIKENLLFLLFFIFLADIAFHWVVFHHLGINKSFIYSILFLLIYLGAFKKWSILKRDKNIYLK